MKAAVLQDYFKLGFEEIPEPEPAPNEVKIKVVATGICGSEIHAYKGTHPFRVPPSILGHEMAGDVVAVGEDVTGVAVGERVTINPQRVCHECEQCLSGNENRCASKLMLGVQGWTGSFAEYVVAPEELVYKLPDHLSYEEGTMAEPLAVAVHAVRISGLGPGSSAVVLGGGTIGLCTLVAARAAGATATIVTDAVDFNLQVARDLGATATVNVRSQNLKEVVAEVTGGRGADYAFVTVGLSAVMNQAIESVKKGGRVVAIALFEEPITIKETFNIIGSERIIQGSMTYSPEDVQRALDMIASGEVEIDKLITQRLPIADVQRGFQIVDEKLEDCVKVVLTYSRG
jgi:2-desacetyl-2-hydroxyethyl bacteriochlorophyllide A dehydrogenase